MSPIRKNAIIYFLISSTLLLYTIFLSTKMNNSKSDISPVQVERTTIEAGLLRNVRTEPPPVLYTDKRWIFVVTPTYLRGTQAPDLTSLAQTLMLRKGSLHWIVVEDAQKPTVFVENLLRRTGLNYTHLNVLSEKNKTSKVRGCSQRNLALAWIKKNVRDGVMYFADDDNVFDVRLFDEIRDTKKVGLIPAGNFANTGISGPIVKQGKVTGFLDPWKNKRKFRLDMATLAINVGFWLERGAPLFNNRTSGYMETRILEAMKVTMEDLEPKGQNATLLLAWHTKTVYKKALKSHVKKENITDSNIPTLLKNVFFA